jgi:hypothetical protein
MHRAVIMKRLILGLALALGSLASCATTSILSTWKKPGVEQLAFKRVVVVVPVSDGAMRRRAEDQLVAALAPVPAVPSYQVVRPEADTDAIKAAVKAGGFDGALVLRVAAVDRETSWVPGSYSGPYYTYGAWGWYDRGYTRTDTYVQVETNIYSLPSEDLLWGATSRTANPSGLQDLIDEVTDSLRDELDAAGLTQKPLPVSRSSFHVLPWAAAH